MKWIVIITCMMHWVLLAAMDDSRGVLRVAQKKKLSEEVRWNIWRFWRKKLNNPNHRDWAGNVIQQILNQPVKHYILTKVLFEDMIKAAPICLAHQWIWPRCSMSPSKKRAIFFPATTNTIDTVLLYNFSTHTAKKIRIRSARTYLDVHWLDDQRFGVITQEPKSASTYLSMYDDSVKLKTIKIPTEDRHIQASAWHPVTKKILLVTDDALLYMVDAEQTLYDSTELLSKHLILNKSMYCFCVPNPVHNSVFISIGDRYIVANCEKNEIMYLTGAILLHEPKWNSTGSLCAYMYQSSMGDRPAYIVDMYHQDSHEVVSALIEDYSATEFFWVYPDCIYVLRRHCPRTWQIACVCVNAAINIRTELIEIDKAVHLLGTHFIRTYNFFETLYHYNQIYNTAPQLSYADAYKLLEGHNVNNEWLALDQALLLDAIGGLYTDQSDTSIQYQLDKASQRVFETMPVSIRTAIKPLIQEYESSRQRSCSLSNLAGYMQRLTL